MSDSRHSQTPISSLFRRLDALEDGEETSHAAQTRWMVPYADLLTLLLGLFLVLFTVPMQVDASSPEGFQGETLPAVETPEVLPEQITEEAIDTLQSRLEEALNIPGIEIAREERGLIVSLSDSILFAPGNADLSASAKQTLDRFVEQLQQTPQGLSHPIRVEGHTDNTPINTRQYPSNWELSTARATNILKYLTIQHQISPETLSAAGYGEFRPIAQNSSIEGKQKNRRVDIVILSPHPAKQEPATELSPKTSGVQPTGQKHVRARGDVGTPGKQTEEVNSHG